MNKIIEYLSIIIIALLTFHISATGQQTENPIYNELKESRDFTEDSLQEIDFYALEEMLDVEIDVASFFTEDELVVGSTVSSISSDEWKMFGARRTMDALSNELSVIIYDYLHGDTIIGIRGFASAALVGTAYLLDGVPLNSFDNGKITFLPDFGLGTLDKIEVIKGPGSAIYGSDAFHGVVSMKTFESNKDHYSFECAGAYPLYGDANVKVSRGFAGNLFRINFSASTSGQPPQEQEYEYMVASPPNKETATWTREPAYQVHTGVLKLNIDPASKVKISLGSYFNYGKYSDYPGMMLNWSQMNGFTYLGKYDTSSIKSLFMMENASLEYKMGKNITIVSNAYFHSYDRFSILQTDNKGSRDIGNLAGSRGGANIIFKQPDNIINLQWFIAYSFTYMKSDSAIMQHQNWDPNPALIPVYGKLGSNGPEVKQSFSGKGRTIHSIYGQLKWEVIKGSLYTLLGSRLDNYSDYSNQVTPRGGVIFLPADKFSVKALYGRAFRAATGTEVYGAVDLIKENKDLEPETIDIYELILMYKVKKCKVSLNGFYSKWKNGMVQAFNPGFLSGHDNEPVIYDNEGKNEAFGGEFKMFYTLEPAAFDLGVSYTKSRAIDVSSITTPDTYDYLDYAAFPEYIINAGFFYKLKKYNTAFYLKNRFYFGMKEAPYNMRPGQKNDDLPLYWRTDLNINNMINENTDITLDVLNLFNRKNYIPALFGQEGGIVEPGISVLIRAGYRL